MTRDRLVYLAGPLTPKHGRLAEENVVAALKIFLELLNLGIPAICPHLPGAFPSAWSNVPYATWMAYSFVLIDHATEVLMLPGWESSEGAVNERAYATGLGKPVYDGIAQVLAREAVRT